MVVVRKSRISLATARADSESIAGVADGIFAARNARITEYGAGSRAAGQRETHPGNATFGAVLKVPGTANSLQNFTRPCAFARK